MCWHLMFLNEARKACPSLDYGNVFMTFIFKDIFDQTSPCQMELSRDVIWIIWKFSWWCHLEGKLLANLCESKISAYNSIEGSRFNVYSLGLIISLAGLPKQLLFLFTWAGFMSDWQVIKWRKRAEYFVFIANSVLVALYWNMECSASLLDDADLED